MEKLLISVADPQAAWLRRRAADLGVSVSELVRSAIQREQERTHQQSEGERACKATTQT